MTTRLKIENVTDVEGHPHCCRVQVLRGPSRFDRSTVETHILKPGESVETYVFDHQDIFVDACRDRFGRVSAGGECLKCDAIQGEACRSDPV